jgi:hypothetical protein
VAIRSVPSPLLQPDNLRAATRGRAITSTFGPFVDHLGRPIFVDTYEPIKIIGILRAGQAKPFLYVSTPAGPGTVKQLDLAAGSIWIAADVLDSAAPVGGYVGLRNMEGTVLFDTGVPIASNVITIPAVSVVELDLKLDPQLAAGGSGPGADARQALISTPTTATFHFAPGGATIPRAS